ncbi:MAG: leucine-rich repeat protein, partial [Prevotellaceae bacterium]|nr:leucine-rich repeat protein [Candidatus Faecinaster equi]
DFKGAYTIPDSVKEIGNGAFSGCSGLTSIEIPSFVSRIGWKAFEDCASLRSIRIPDSVTVIDEDTFFYCRGLKSVEIPGSVTEIRTGAFDLCGFCKIHIDNPNPDQIEIHEFAFLDTDYLSFLFVPRGTGAAYRHKHGVGNFKLIVEANKDEWIECMNEQKD